MQWRIRRLELRVRPGTRDWDLDRPYPTIDFFLDGRDLQDHLRRFLPPGQQDSDAYLGHPVGTDVDALLHGRWSGDTGEDFDGRAALLGCCCSVIGCGPLVARIDMDEDTVTWSDFSRYRGRSFDYEPIAFVFDRRQYDAAVAEFAALHPAVT